MNEIGFFIREAGDALKANFKTSRKSDDKFMRFLEKADRNNYNKSDSVRDYKKSDRFNSSNFNPGEIKENETNNKSNTLNFDEDIVSQDENLVSEIDLTQSEDVIASHFDDEQEINYFEAINNISVILNITPDKLVSLLDELNISLDDLTDVKILNSLLTTVFKVENLDGLLEVPDIAEKINNIKLILNEIIDATLVKIEDNLNIESTHDNNINDISEVDDLVQLTNENFELEQGLEQNFNNNSNNSNQKTYKNVSSDSSNTLNMNFADNVENINNDGLENIVSLNNSDTSFKNISPHVQLRGKVSLPSVNNILDQITENLKIEYKGDTSEIRIKLKPEHLGDISLKISNINGLIMAQFVAENSRIKEIIESNFNMLKDSLEEQGIEVESLSVSVGDDGNNDNMDKFLVEKQKSILRANKIAYNIMNEEIENNILSEAGILGSRLNYRI